MSWREHQEYQDAVRTQLRRVSVISVDDSGSQQLVTATGLNSEQFEGVVRNQHFGLSSVPPAGGEGLILTQGGRSDRAHILGLEHPQFRPTGQAVGSTVLYDGNGQAVSLVKNNLRIVGSATITITAPTIVLNGNVHLGGTGGVPISMKGTTDTAGNADVDNLATKVFAV